MTDFATRYIHAASLVKTMRNKQARQDLDRMVRAVDKIRTLRSQEAVICRRKRQTTRKYNDLDKQCEEQLDQLEKYIVFARLLYG